jgi:hypothetical protein
VSTVAAVRMNVFRANHQLTVHVVSYVSAVVGLLFINNVINSLTLIQGEDRKIVGGHL